MPVRLSQVFARLVADRACHRTGLLACLLAALACLHRPANGQTGVHYPHGPWSPPGHVGRSALARGGPLLGYFQPVQVILPQGAAISLAAHGAFTEPTPAPLKAGLLIGQVYRLRISEIPGYPGEELFPTIELVDRLYPPPGLRWKFAIPIEIAQADLDAALAGRFVTRVVYLEDPENALPVQGDPLHPAWWDAAPRDNPLELADRLGRPVAIVRLGGRVPNPDLESDPAFLAGCPPFILPTKQAEVPPAADEDADQPPPEFQREPHEQGEASGRRPNAARTRADRAAAARRADATQETRTVRRGLLRKVALRPKPTESRR